MLQKVAEQTDHELMLPEMVVEEYLSHYRRDVEVATKKAKDAFNDLRRQYPSWRGLAPSFGNVAEEAEGSRRDELEQIFRIHPTPAGAWQEALIREARRRPPAKTSWDGPGSGARDVVIWPLLQARCERCPLR
jgi:hypothetical protein